MIIRFGYCPPNPGPWSRKYKHVKYYTDFDSAIEKYDGHSSFWIKFSGRYREISYEQLIELKDKYNTVRSVRSVRSVR